MNIGYVLAGYLIDLLGGDPPYLPHPVVFIGRGIGVLERLLLRVGAHPLYQRMAGIVMTVLVVGGTYEVTFLIVKIFGMVHPWIGAGLEVWLISTTIAGCSLGRAARKIRALLEQKDLETARWETAKIVGRDTQSLDSTELSRATVESVAENIVDAIVAPLFYAFLGGAPLAMAYRAINTLDSMVGYRNERYLYFGWASARLDDLANYLPARWAGLLLIIAAFLLGNDAKRAFFVLRRDARLHPSPNSGIPEAAVAGAFGIRLGGLNFYNGIPSFRAYLGDNIVPLQPVHIRKVVLLMKITSLLAISSGAGITLLFLWLVGVSYW